MGGCFHRAFFVSIKLLARILIVSLSILVKTEKILRENRRGEPGNLLLKFVLIFHGRVTALLTFVRPLAQLL